MFKKPPADLKTSGTGLNASAAELLECIVPTDLPF